MSHKQKAEELIEKFSKSTLIFYDRVGLSEVKYEAKRCALIAVDEIIFANPHSNPFNTEVYSTMEYWQKVKQEIEKI